MTDQNLDSTDADSDDDFDIEYVSDHALYPPATIGIIGAGPVGIEAALYARFLGYEVLIWERGEEIAANVTVAANDSAPFGEQVTRLGMNALAAQFAKSEDYSPRQDDATISAKEWKEEYLLPLAKSDLLRKSILTNTTIESVTVRDNEDGDEDEEAPLYLFTVRAADGQVWDQVAAVIDTAGPAANGPFLEGAEPDADDGNLSTVIGYYFLGAKSRPNQDSAFTVHDGHHQIRSLFAIIGDREGLDLYQ